MSPPLVGFMGPVILCFMNACFSEFSEHLPASYSPSPFYPLAQLLLLIQFLPKGHPGSALAAGRRFYYESSLETWHPVGERGRRGHKQVFLPPFLSGSRLPRPPFPATGMSMAVAGVPGGSFGRQTGLRVTASSFHSLAAGKSLKPFEPSFPPLVSGKNDTCW